MSPVLPFSVRQNIAPRGNPFGAYSGQNDDSHPDYSAHSFWKKVSQQVSHNLAAGNLASVILPLQDDQRGFRNQIRDDLCLKAKERLSSKNIGTYCTGGIAPSGNILRLIHFRQTDSRDQ